MRGCQAGARRFISTQAVTAYRNPGLRPCGHAGLAQVDEDGVLVFAPDPVQAFASAAFTQFQEWHLHPGAGLVLLDWFCSGRAARGERWAFARFQTRNDVFVGDELIFRDALALESSAHSSVAWHRDGRFDVFALLLLIGTPLQSFAGPLLAEVNARPIERAGPVVVGASRLRDGAVLRIAGATVEAVAKEWERHLRPLRAIPGDDPWRRKW
ncbi:MAG: urease accessory protein UreD [Verrucomicrobiota bacterium]